MLRYRLIALQDHSKVAGQFYQRLQLKYHQVRPQVVETAQSEMEVGQFVN